MRLDSALSMGRYGVYVWTCYGLALLAVVYLSVTVRRRWRTQLALARHRAARGGTEA